MMEISIVIPTYNQSPRYLREAIESALTQTYPENKYEVLVVDDGSYIVPPDDVVQLFRDRNVRLVKKKHGGIAHTLNVGVRSMKGKYFKWLSSDDVLFETALETLISCAGEDRIVYGDWVRIDQNSRMMDTYHEPTFSDDATMKKFLFRRFFGNASATLIPKSAFSKVGIFDDSLPYYEDADWWLRAVFLYGYSFVHADGLIAKYRIHPGQLTVRNGKKPLIGWRIRKRLFSAHGFSGFSLVREPTFATLLRRMFVHDVARLYLKASLGTPAPMRLKRIKHKLMM